MKNLTDSKLDDLIVSNTIDGLIGKENEKLKIVSCAKLISDSIQAITQKRSIHEVNEIK
jgi:phosphoribosylpyrophosphate synthetase